MDHFHITWLIFYFIVFHSCNSQQVTEQQQLDCSSTGDPDCTCNPGYTGTNCDLDIDECLVDSSCWGNGKCINTDGSYICSCSPGFTGERCQFDINECSLPIPPYCGVHGVCVETFGSYTCGCESGYTGVDCEVEIDECELFGSSCENGLCKDLLNGFECNCFTGWTGDRCEEDIDYCDVPDRQFGLCYETGTNRCTDGNSTYICTCVVGFTGYNCSLDINECELDLCLNGANCTNLLFGNFLCHCAEGYSGELCEIDLSPCDPSPCRYNSTCYDMDSFTTSNATGVQPDDIPDQIGEYFCDCLDGYSGKDCSDECPGEPCHNDGVCHNKDEGFICNCVRGFSGDLCEIDDDFCTSSTCSNGGTCVDGLGYLVICLCPDGFNGSRCKIDLPYCQPDSCINNGTCVEGLGRDISCECPDGFSGEECEEDLDFCRDDTCRNGGICIEGVGITITCICPNGTLEPYCDTLSTPPPLIDGINIIVLAVTITLAILALFFLCCFITTLCISACLERRKRRFSPKRQAKLWTLEYHNSPASSLDDTRSDRFDYRDMGPSYAADTLSQHSFESQTAMVRFTLNRGGNIITHPSHTFVRTPSCRSQGLRKVSEAELGDITKEDLVDVVEQNLATNEVV